MRALEITILIVCVLYIATNILFGDPFAPQEESAPKTTVTIEELD